MKQNFIFPFAIAGMVLLSLPAAAQVIVSPSSPDIAVTSGGTTDARNVNCDMIYHPGGGGQLRAIAYDDYNTNTSYVYLEDYSGGTTTITIPGAIDIDVVLGDDMNNPGTDFIATVVYNASSTAIIETYTITGTGGGSLVASPTNIATLPVMTTGISNVPPHIDLYPDMNNLISGIPALHEYAVTWSEYQPFVGNDVYLTHGDIANPGSFGTQYTITTGGTGIWPDVACLTDITTGDPYAYVPYMNWPNIDLWEVNLNTTATSLTSAINSNNVEKSVRIEAMNQYDPGAGLQKYEIAYAESNGSSLDMISYNDLAGNLNLSAALGGGGNNIHPAVSAGPGALFNGGYGNKQHSVCWYNDGVPVYYSQAIEVNSGNVSATYPDYYEVNMTPMIFIPLDPYYAPIGVSTSSNWGDDELLTAWNNSDDIYYKYQGDISQYKITSVNEVKPLACKLYPNPATSAISITGVTQAAYSITDVSGRILASGEVTKANSTLDIAQLAKGMYIIHLTENNKTSILKFVKQ